MLIGLCYGSLDDYKNGCVHMRIAYEICNKKQDLKMF